MDMTTLFTDIATLTAFLVALGGLAKAVAVLIAQVRRWRTARKGS